MSAVSGSTSVSIVGAVQADPSQPTLRVEALSSGKLSTKLVSLASISLKFHEEVQINGTQTVNLKTNSNAGSGTGAVAEQFIVPNGTVTFRVGEVSTTTSIVISFTVCVPLAGENSYLVGPGDSEIWLNLTTIVLVDGE